MKNYLKINLLIISIIFVVSLKNASAEENKKDRFNVVEMQNDTLIIENAFLNENIVDKAIQISTDAKSINLINIPGGILKHVRRLAMHVENMPVIVQGLCLSGCAFVALSGKTIALRKNTDKPATMLGIHGLFNFNNHWSWSELSVADLEFYYDKLKVIDKSIIENALKFRSPVASGLFILRDRNSTPLVGDAYVFLCEKAPENCIPIYDIDLKSMNIIEE